MREFWLIDCVYLHSDICNYPCSPGEAPNLNCTDCVLDNTCLFDPPCQNGGTCILVQSPSNFICDCPEPYQGENCSVCGISQCLECSKETNACLKCEPNWKGANCDECTLPSCLTCSTEENLCMECVPGSKLGGGAGECVVDPCSSSPCPDHSMCSDINETSHLCTCEDGYILQGEECACNSSSCGVCAIDKCNRCNQMGIGCSECDFGYTWNEADGQCRELSAYDERTS